MQREEASMHAATKPSTSRTGFCSECRRSTGRKARAPGVAIVRRRPVGRGTTAGPATHERVEAGGLTKRFTRSLRWRSSAPWLESIPSGTRMLVAPKRASSRGDAVGIQRIAVRAETRSLRRRRIPNVEDACRSSPPQREAPSRLTNYSGAMNNPWPSLIAALSGERVPTPSTWPVREIHRLCGLSPANSDGARLVRHQPQRRRVPSLPAPN